MSLTNYGCTGRTLAELEALPSYECDAILARTLVANREIQELIAQYLREAESLLVERMQARGATLADCGDYEAKLERTRTYDYDVEQLAQLQSHLDVDAYERAVQWVRPEPYVKVSKSELNRLAKLGGAVAEIIGAAVTERPGAARLVLTRKAATA